jgi:hypothetical protein
MDSRHGASSHERIQIQPLLLIWPASRKTRLFDLGVQATRMSKLGSCGNTASICHLETEVHLVVGFHRCLRCVRRAHDMNKAEYQLDNFPALSSSSTWSLGTS